MNGRIYDPTIGRFMSADPFIQAPYELQSHNRYAYVMNNPLLYTDPSGFNWFKKLVIAVVVIVATVYTMGAVAAYMGFAGTMSAAITAAGATFWGSIAMGAAGGFVGGFLSTALNGGSFSQSLKAGLIGGITGAAMGYVGFTYTGNTFGNYIGHAVVSCASSVASGGGSQSCGRAAAASLVGTYVSANTTNANGWNEYSRGAATIVTGGVTSRMMGGTFADGATSAAYGYLFNAFAHDMVAEAANERREFDRRVNSQALVSICPECYLIGAGGAVKGLYELLAANGTVLIENGVAQVTLNRLAGNAFRDEIAGVMRSAGYDVATEVSKRTIFGMRYIDIEVSLGGKILGGIETKFGGAIYNASQRAKDYYLYMTSGYRVNVVRP
jgi:hypothetical protein